MIEVICNDRLGKKVRVKCNADDTIGDLKKLIAAQVTRSVVVLTPRVYFHPSCVFLILHRCINHHTCKYTRTHTHTNSFSLSLSLSLFHIHTLEPGMLSL